MGLTGATEQALVAWQIRAAARIAPRGSRPETVGQHRHLDHRNGCRRCGLGGLTTALIELPATTAMLLRAIQGAASREGFDPSAEENVQVRLHPRFVGGRSLGAMTTAQIMGFFSVRLTADGPRSAKASLLLSLRGCRSFWGRKLAAQTVPVLGALAGGGANYLYARYYQQIARVHFGLRRSGDRCRYSA